MRIALAVALATKCLHLLQMCKCLFSVRLSQPVGLIFFYSVLWVLSDYKPPYEVKLTLPGKYL